MSDNEVEIIVEENPSESPEIVYEEEIEPVIGEKIVLGTSGYCYDMWGPGKLPKELRDQSKCFYSKVSSDRFKEYQKHFNSVEINCTRHKKLTEKMCKTWYDSTGDDFEFTVKMPLQITHYKKLNDFEEFWEDFYPSVKQLKHKLSCLLFQFKDKAFKYTEKNIEKLAKVKSAIPSNIRCAFEFRDRSWYGKDVDYSIFSDNWTLVTIFYTHGGMMHPDLIIGDLFGDRDMVPEKGKYTNDKLSYVRLHGSLGYCEGTYGVNFLSERVMPLLRSEKNYVYFNNTDSWDAFTMDDFDNGNVFNKKVNEFYPYSNYNIRNTTHQLPSAITDALFVKYLSFR